MKKSNQGSPQSKPNTYLNLEFHQSENVKSKLSPKDGVPHSHFVSPREIELTQRHLLQQASFLHLDQGSAGLFWWLSGCIKQSPEKAQLNKDLFKHVQKLELFQRLVLQ